MADFRRWLYRGGRPNRLARVADRLTAALSSRGTGPEYLVTLEVPGRKSGRTLRLPLVVAEVGGERYLVSMLGDGVNWVRNVRAAGGDAVLRHGDREAVRLEDVAPERRAPVLKAYLGRAPERQDARVDIASRAKQHSLSRRRVRLLPWRRHLTTQSSCRSSGVASCCALWWPGSVH